MSAGYPFSAIVGQEELKLALLLNAVSPSVGGVLVRGEKGTAKSTAVRALAGLLPPVEVVAGCPFSCEPAAPNPACPAGPHPGDLPVEKRAVRLVELPVGASADRLTGTLDLEKALLRGERRFEPGLLAAAHRGILYVDEVNLLPDHLVDLLLDVAAMGVNRVEREGVGVEHPARFLLVGTMNPEEGELRPQLLDRFGLSVEVSGMDEVEERAEVVRRRLRYEADRDGFAAGWAEADGEVASQVTKAARGLPDVTLPDGRLMDVSAVCAALGVDGLRGDVVTAKAALALAAWNGRGEAEREDVERAARLALAHRRRRNPFDEPGVTPEEISSAMPPNLDDGPDHDPDDDPGGGSPTPGKPDGDGTDGKPGGEPDPASEGGGERLFGATSAAGFDPSRLGLESRGAGGPEGRRSRSVGERGGAVFAREARPGETDVSVAATLLAAAPFQRRRGRRETGLVLRPEDLRANVREGREGNLIVFCVDASGSMAARARMETVKGTVLELLSEAYRKRDRVALVQFRGAGAKTVLPPTSSVELAASRLAGLPTGGRTPLAAGLGEAMGVVVRERRRDPSRKPVLIVLTDGRATDGRSTAAVAAEVLRSGINSVVVDTEAANVRLGLARGLAETLGARYVRFDGLLPGSLAGLAKRTTERGAA